MEVFNLTYPGTALVGLSVKQTQDVQMLLYVCESHLADAAVGLFLFEDARVVTAKAMTRPPLPWEQREPEPGTWPREYQHRLPFIYAHTVLYALDGIGKVLDVLAKEPGLSADVATAAADFRARLPDVTPTRDSSHHMEDRARHLDRNGQPLNLEPITTGAIHAPHGGALILDTLEDDRLCFTGSDDAYHRMPITADSVLVAQECLQRVLDSLSWRGPAHSSPYSVSQPRPPSPPQP